MTPQTSFEFLNRAAGIAPLAAPRFERGEALFAPFRFATAAAAALAFGAGVAGEIWRLRGGERQAIHVDVPAAGASLAPHLTLRRNGSLVAALKDETAATGFYQSGDRRWLYLRGAQPHLSTRIFDLLNAANSREAVVESVARWNGQALEDALAFLKMPGALVRSAEEWRALAGIAPPPIQLKKIGDAPPFRPREAGQALRGLRVLDVTRYCAGAAATALLGSHGAEVLQICSPRDPLDPPMAFSGGKRLANLDLAKPGDAETLRHLVREAEIFVDSHRPGVLAGLGFSPATLAHTAPGIVVVEIAAFYGPWAPRRGFEEVVQAATGLALEAAKSGKSGLPELICHPVLSVLTGYLAAAGAKAALLKRIRAGGSWQVNVSLAATAAWVMSLGRCAAQEGLPDGIDPYLYSCETTSGWFELLGPVVRMDKTPPIKGALPDGFVSPRWASLHEEANGAEEQSAQT
ncbi:hypothetical protein FHS83_000934 [Rhizomicrobium palustre]|uniref:Carnitine dehydratase n=1 Tax=Rhizomicrobium palustre TaxID=189966 RepID=A0A846MW51_9PROT|nr:CoA transferase [Rhizomicrobium palustre]NIK87616.1 hypothetical protein [Rhizomicrobium palustre]